MNLLQKWLLLVSAGLLLAGCGTELHKTISPAHVQRVELWGPQLQGARIADPQMANQIVEWFNAGSDPRENTAKVGPTPDAVISIHLTNGEIVRIARAGQDVEVSQKGRQYWLRQPKLRQLLDSLTKPPVARRERGKPLPVARLAGYFLVRSELLGMATS